MAYLIKKAPSLTRTELLARPMPSITHPRFKQEMIPALWDAAVKYGIDPVGMVAQAAHETGWGNYPGNAVPEQHNTCGLKWHDSWRMQIIDYPEEGDHMLSHAAFANWRTGAEAHAQHLLGYMGIKLPAWQVNVDPRYSLALANAELTGGATEWSELGGHRRWAPNDQYGFNIEHIITQLINGQGI